MLSAPWKKKKLIGRLGNPPVWDTAVPLAYMSMNRSPTSSLAGHTKYEHDYAVLLLPRPPQASKGETAKSWMHSVIAMHPNRRDAHWRKNIGTLHDRARPDQSHGRIVSVRRTM